MTIAATLATAPLMAHHFGAVSIASLPANLLALPAVAPVMWLGMLAALVGQLPWLPVEPLTGLAGLLAAYVAQVAHWLGDPGWAQVGSASVPRCRCWRLRGARGRIDAGAALARAASRASAPGPRAARPPTGGAGCRRGGRDRPRRGRVAVDRRTRDRAAPRRGCA